MRRGGRICAFQRRKLEGVSLAVMRLAEGWGTAEDDGAWRPVGMGREARVEEVMAAEEGEPIVQLCEMA